MSNDNEQAKADHPLGWNVPNINDLRSAIAHIKNFKGQYIETDHLVDPKAELAGVYRYIGAGGTVMRPTRIGPAMTFNNVKDCIRHLVATYADVVSGETFSLHEPQAALRSF